MWGQLIELNSKEKIIHKLVKNLVVIGSELESDIILNKKQFKFEIEKFDDQIILKDLSVNGVFLNGCKIGRNNQVNLKT